MLAILILAAGKSSRMDGVDKLMQDVKGNPLLCLVTERALKTGCPVFVALPSKSGPRSDAVSDLPVQRVMVKDAHLGMAHSIRAGIAALPPQTQGVMILPADMPELTSADLSVMRDQWQASDKAHILRATSSSGQPGHPVIFPAMCFGALMELKGDQGAKSNLLEQSHLVKTVALPASHALTDLDTPEDWSKWRGSKS